MARIDFPQNPSKPDTYLNGQDSGQQELISLTSVTNYPTGQSPQRSSQTNEVPFNAYDTRRCRACTVQLSSYGVTGTCTFQLLVSVDGRSYAPFGTTVAGVYTTTFTLPTGGTITAPNATILPIDTPWFAWLKVSITGAASAGNAFLSVYKRD